MLLADDCRQEQNGKLTLLGYMPGNRFTVGNNPVIPGNMEVLQSLSIVFVFVDGEGAFRVSASLTDPNGVERFTPPFSQEFIKNPTGVLNIIMAMRPFPLLIGEYTLTITLDDTPFRRTFLMERGASTP